MSCKKGKQKMMLKIFLQNFGEKHYVITYICYDEHDGDLPQILKIPNWNLN